MTPAPGTLPVTITNAFAAQSAPPATAPPTTASPTTAPTTAPATTAPPTTGSATGPVLPDTGSRTTPAMLGALLVAAGITTWRLARRPLRS